MDLQAQGLAVEAHELGAFGSGLGPECDPESITLSGNNFL